MRSQRCRPTEKVKITSTEIKQALANKHYKDFFLTEVKSGSTWFTSVGDMKILDGLAIRKSWSSPCFTGYEIKVSRSDFLRDAKFYTYEELCNCLYVVCPKGMIDRTELPESVGLMYYDREKKTITTKKKAIYRKIEYTPDLLLYIIYSRLDSDRYPFFSEKQEYFKAYLEGKAENRSLGRFMKSKLLEENIRLERELETVRHFQGKYEDYKAIMGVLNKHHIWGYRSSYAEELDKALSRAVPEGVSDVRASLEIIVSRLRRLEGKDGEEGAVDG